MKKLFTLAFTYLLITSVTTKAQSCPVYISGQNQICYGTSTLLTASPADSYTWSANAGSVTTQTIIVSSFSGSASYTVTATTGTCVSSAVVYINVIVENITVNSPTMCSGGSTVLTANGAINYSWTPSTGLSATTGSSVIAAPGTTTTYTVTGDCPDANASPVVTVNPSPMVTVNSATVCAGTPVTLTANGANTYSWNTGATTATITPSPTVTTNYTVTGTAANNCTNTATSKITVNPLPTLSVNSHSICAGGTTTLTASGASNYTWSANAGSATTNTVLVNPAGTTTYSVSSSLGTCSITKASTVTVNPVPSIFISGPTAKCSNSSIMLSANGGTTYTWSANASGVHTSSVYVSPSVATVYTVTGSNSSNCASSATFSVAVGQTPTVTITGNLNICYGQTTTLQANGATTYTWNVNNTSTTSNSVIVSPTSSADTIYYSATSGPCSIYNNPVIINASNALKTQLASRTICQGSSTILQASGSNSYTWMPGGATTSSVSVNPISTTIYTVTGKTNSCVYSTSDTVNVVVCNTSTTCADYDFSGGQFTGWTGKYNRDLSGDGSGSFDSVTNYGLLNTTGIDSSGKDLMNNLAQEICNVGSDNYISTLNRIALGHNLSVRLGSDRADYGHQTLTKTYAITSANTIFTYWFAFVSNGELHGFTVEPYFQVKFYDGSNNEIVAARNYMGASSSSSVISTSVIAGSYNDYIVYHDWSSVSLNFGSYVGQNITAVFETADCAAGGHFGYAYIDVDCSAPLQITQSAPHPCPTETLTAPMGYSYNWLGTGLVGATNTYTAVVNAAGTYSVVLTDTSGTNVTLTTTVAQPGLKPVVSFSANQVCLGTATTFTNQTTNAPTNYVWHFGDSDTSTTLNPTHTYTTAGTQTVTLVAGNYCGADSLTKTVTVNSSPTLTVNSATICAGNTATLTASGANTYTWSTNETTPSITPSPTVTTNYTVTGTDANTCTGTTTSTITVNPTPTVSINSAPAVCISTCAGFTPSVTSYTTISNYNWNFGDGGPFIGVANPCYFYAVPGSYTVSLTVTDANGCVGTATTNITVNPTPSVSIQVANASCSGICNGSATATASGGTGAYNFMWTPAGIATNTSATSTENNLCAGTYSCTVSDANSCAATTIVTVNEPTPLIASSTAGIINCNGAATTVTVSATGGTTNYSGTGTFTVTANSYTYTVSDANSCTATTTITVNQPNAIASAQSPTICAGSYLIVGTHTYTTAGTYTDVLTAHNGCDSTVTTNLSINVIDTSITVTLAYYPILTVHATGATYQWVSCGTVTNTPIPGATQQSYTTTSNALAPYAVIITQGGCTAISDCRHDAIIEGIAKYSEADNIQVYPNPTKDVLNVELEMLNEKAELKLFDVNGKLILTQTIIGKTIVDVSNLNAGVYNLSLLNSDGVVNKRVVVVK
jgi:PKD repeat protein